MFLSSSVPSIQVFSAQCPVIQSFQCLQCSRYRVLQCSRCALFQCSSLRVFQCSFPGVRCSNVPVFLQCSSCHCSSVPAFHNCPSVVPVFSQCCSVLVSVSVFQPSSLPGIQVSQCPVVQSSVPHVPLFHCLHQFHSVPMFQCSEHSSKSRARANSVWLACNSARPGYADAHPG